MPGRNESYGPAFLFETNGGNMSTTIKNYAQLVTLSELADILEIPSWRISRWRRNGLIPSVKMGRTHYYNVESVTKTLRRREKLGSQNFSDTGYARG